MKRASAVSAGRWMGRRQDVNDQTGGPSAKRGSAELLAQPTPSSRHNRGDRSRQRKALRRGSSLAAGLYAWGVWATAFAQPAPSTPAAPSAEGPDADSRAAEPSKTEPNQPEPSRAEPGAATPASPTRGVLPRTPSSLFPVPGQDARRLRSQGDERPDGDGETVSLERIFAEDWWSHARPVFEFHGYFRTRAELYNKFALGRVDRPGQELFPQPSDNQFQSIDGNNQSATVGPALCRDSGASALTGCQNNTQSSANMRFRLNPELHVSDNLRVITQVDMLDNLVLGSRPEGYALSPAAGGGYAVDQRNGYVLNGYQDATQVPPEPGVNGLESSLRVKRAWGEYATPLGELRFGRMPHHWGLGMLWNAGDEYDDDVQSTVDRLMFAGGLPMLDLVLAATWDFPNQGPTQSPPIAGFQAYDRAQSDDVRQWGFMLLRQRSPQLTDLALSKDEVVFNSGLYVLYRSQELANDVSGTQPGVNVPGGDPATLADSGFSRRGLSVWQPDLWLQLLYKRLRAELEVAAIIGDVESQSVVPNNISDFDEQQDNSQRLRQFGFAFELQQKLVEDRLRLNFNLGWSSGDADAFDPNTPGDLIPGPGERQVNDDTVSTFRFHPSYRVDRILHRYILQRVQGTYYVAPSLDYDFTREPNGQRIGGGINLVWTRASEPVQTPGHNADLGLELGGSLFFQSKDGGANDGLDRLGGFYARLDYSALFPLAGLGYPSVTRETFGLETSTAQMLRLYLGVLF